MKKVIANILNLLVAPSKKKMVRYVRDNHERKALVFHIGVDSGFYSEYNNMVLAILHCKYYGVSFKLYSADANFGIEKGWDDFFMPFCEEVDDELHSSQNKRFPQSNQTVYFGRYLWSLLKAIRHFDFGRIIPYRTIRPAEKRRRKQFGFDYYTYDLWRDFRRWDGVLSLPELQSECHDIVEQTYRLNDNVKDVVYRMIRDLGIDGKYAAIHVRTGDKVKETRLISPEIYMDELKMHTQIKNVFVFTDEYDVFVSLKREWKDYCFYTLTRPEEHGYNQSEIDEKDKDLSARKNRMLFLFACVELMKGAEVFVGTISSNPGMFMGMRCPDKVYYVDEPLWRIW